MATSRFLARLIGPLFLVIGIGMLFNGDVYRAMAEEILRSVPLIYLTGILSLLGGLALLHFHNIWALDWRVIITVVGWLSVIGGVARMLVPQVGQAIGSSLFSHQVTQVVGGIVTLILGAVLTFNGYRPGIAPQMGANRQ